MEEGITSYVIDACGLIAYLRDEEGGHKLKMLMKDSCNRFLMHAVNLGEVYYDTLRVSGKENARMLFDDISSLPINIIWDVDIPFIELIGKFKISYRISYADSFVLALAEKEHAIVISTDHHEFDFVERNTDIVFYWLR